jgi:hypothetical protein
MPLYGPTPGVLTGELLDSLVDMIDSTRSGNTTGWSLVRDCRNPARITVGIPAPVGFVSIARKSSVYAPNGVQNLVSGAFEFIGNIHKSPTSNIHYTQSTRYNGSDWSVVGTFGYRTSGDSGASWGSLLSYTSNPGAIWTDSYTRGVASGAPDDATGAYPTAVFRNNAVSESIVRSSGTTAGGIGYSDPVGVSGTGSFFNMGEVPSDIQKPYCYTTVKSALGSNYRAYFFVVTGSSNINLRVIRVLNTITGYSLIGTLTASALAVTAIYGVDYIIDKGTHHEVYLSVLHSGTKKTIKCRTLNGGVDAFDSLAGFTVESYDNQVETNLDFADDFMTSAVLPGNSHAATPSALLATTYGATDGTKSYTKAATGAVDANPDFNGLRYEYVVFESTHTSNSDKYYLILLQPDTSQVGPPTVVPITGFKPIFARVVRKWDTTSHFPLKFFFDPVIPSGSIPGTYNAIGPALISQPVTGVPDSFTLRARVNSRQIFISALSSGGVSQTLHINIASPVIPLTARAASAGNNDNIVVSAAGHEAGTGVIYLGRNGFSEEDMSNVRNDGGRGYYGVGYESTYKDILDDINSVDNKDYAFKVYVIDDRTNLNTAPSPSLRYLVGEMYQTRYFPRTTGISNFSNVTVDGITYMLFRSTVPGSPHVKNPAVVKDLLIEWS